MLIHLLSDNDTGKPDTRTWTNIISKKLDIIMKDQIETLAEYTYLNERNANNDTEWKDVSANTRASYIKDATEQYEYAQEIFSVLGVSSTTTEKLVKSIAIHVENSTKLMQENAELKAKISRRDVSVRELKEKQKEYLKHMDTMLDSSKSSAALKEAETKLRLLQEKQNVLIDEAKTSADMLEQLIPLQDENKKLIEERDGLEMALNLAIQNQQKQIQKNPSTVLHEADRDKASTSPQLHSVMAEKKHKSSALGKFTENRPIVSEKEKITHTHDVLKQFSSIKDGKIALCKALKIEPINLRSETKLWISIRIKQCGWDVVNKACTKIKKE